MISFKDFCTGLTHVSETAVKPRWILDAFLIWCLHQCLSKGANRITRDQLADIWVNNNYKDFHAMVDDIMTYQKHHD